MILRQTSDAEKTLSNKQLHELLSLFFVFYCDVYCLNYNKTATNLATSTATFLKRIKIFNHYFIANLLIS